MLNIFQYICEATGAVLATGALSEIFDGIKENVDVYLIKKNNRIFTSCKLHGIHYSSWHCTNIRLSVTSDITFVLNTTQ